MTILSLLVFLLLLGILITVHELGHFLVAKWVGMRVDEFAIGFPPRIWKKKKKGTLYSVGLLPFGGYVKIHGENPEEKEEVDQDPRSFDHKPVWARIAVILAGVTMNVLFAFLVLTIAFSVGFTSLNQDLSAVPGAKVKDSKVIVVDVHQDSPAQKAGLQPGDILLGLTNAKTNEDHVLTSIRDLQDYTKARQEAGDTKIIIRFERDGKRYRVDSPLNKEGYPLDVAIQSLDTVRVPVWRAPVVAVKEMGTIFQLTWDALASFGKKLFLRAQLDPNISGPVGIYQATAAATQVGFGQVLLLMVVLSLNLAMLNILPLPALDGGRFVFLFIEAIFRKRVIRKQIEMWLTQISFMLLILLIAVLTIRDVSRLF